MQRDRGRSFNIKKLSLKMDNSKMDNSLTLNNNITNTEEL